MDAVKAFAIKTETFQKLIDYLGSRPLTEVYELFTELRNNSVPVTVQMPDEQPVDKADET